MSSFPYNDIARIWKEMEDTLKERQERLFNREYYDKWFERKYTYVKTEVEETECDYIASFHYYYLMLDNDLIAKLFRKFLPESFLPDSNLERYAKEIYLRTERIIIHKPGTNCEPKTKSKPPNPFDNLSKCSGKHFMALNLNPDLKVLEGRYKMGGWVLSAGRHSGSTIKLLNMLDGVPTLYTPGYNKNQFINNYLKIALPEIYKLYQEEGYRIDSLELRPSFFDIFYYNKFHDVKVFSLDRNSADIDTPDLTDVYAIKNNGKIVYQTEGLLGYKDLEYLIQETKRPGNGDRFGGEVIKLPYQVFKLEWGDVLNSGRDGGFIFYYANLDVLKQRFDFHNSSGFCELIFLSCPPNYPTFNAPNDDEIYGPSANPKSKPKPKKLFDIIDNNNLDVIYSDVDIKSKNEKDLIINIGEKVNIGQNNSFSMKGTEHYFYNDFIKNMLTDSLFFKNTLPFKYLSQLDDKFKEIKSVLPLIDHDLIRLCTLSLTQSLSITNNLFLDNKYDSTKDKDFIIQQFDKNKDLLKNKNQIIYTNLLGVYNNQLNIPSLSTKIKHNKDSSTFTEKEEFLMMKNDNYKVFLDLLQNSTKKNIDSKFDIINYQGKLLLDDILKSLNLFNTKPQLDTVINNKSEILYSSLVPVSAPGSIVVSNVLTQIATFLMQNFLSKSWLFIPTQIVEIFANFVSIIVSDVAKLGLTNFLTNSSVILLNTVKLLLPKIFEIAGMISGVIPLIVTALPYIIICAAIIIALMQLNKNKQITGTHCEVYALLKVDGLVQPLEIAYLSKQFYNATSDDIKKILLQTRNEIELNFYKGADNIYGFVFNDKHEITYGADLINKHKLDDKQAKLNYQLVTSLFHSKLPL